MIEVWICLDLVIVFGGKDSFMFCVKVLRVLVFIKIGLLNFFFIFFGCKENDWDINNILIIYSDVLYLWWKSFDVKKLFKDWIIDFYFKLYDFFLKFIEFNFKVYWFLF